MDRDTAIILSYLLTIPIGLGVTMLMVPTLLPSTKANRFATFSWAMLALVSFISMQLLALSAYN